MQATKAKAGATANFDNTYETAYKNLVGSYNKKFQKIERAAVSIDTSRATWELRNTHYEKQPNLVHNLNESERQKKIAKIESTIAKIDAKYKEAQELLKESSSLLDYLNRSPKHRLWTQQVQVIVDTVKGVCERFGNRYKAMNTAALALRKTLLTQIPTAEQSTSFIPWGWFSSTSNVEALPLPGGRSVTLTPPASPRNGSEEEASEVAVSHSTHTPAPSPESSQHQGTEEQDSVPAFLPTSQPKPVPAKPVALSPRPPSAPQPKQVAPQLPSAPKPTVKAKPEVESESEESSGEESDTETNKQTTRAPTEKRSSVSLSTPLLKGDQDDPDSKSSRKPAVEEHKSPRGSHQPGKKNGPGGNGPKN